MAPSARVPQTPDLGTKILLDVGTILYNREQIGNEFAEFSIKRIGAVDDAQTTKQRFAQFQPVFERLFAKSSPLERLSALRAEGMADLVVTDFKEAHGAYAFALNRLAHRDPDTRVRKAAHDLGLSVLLTCGVPASLRGEMIGNLVHGVCSDQSLEVKNFCLAAFKRALELALEPFEIAYTDGTIITGNSAAVGLSKGLTGELGKIIDGETRRSLIALLDNLFVSKESGIRIPEDIAGKVESNFRRLLRSGYEGAEQDSASRVALINGLALRLPREDVAEVFAQAFGPNHKVNTAILESLTQHISERGIMAVDQAGETRDLLPTDFVAIAKWRSLANALRTSDVIQTKSAAQGVAIMILTSLPTAENRIAS